MNLAVLSTGGTVREVSEVPCRHPHVDVQSAPAWAPRGGERAAA